MILQPSYRMTVFGTDGVTPLTPTSGSVHSDDFKIATSGSSGWQPYLNNVTADFGSTTVPDGTYANGKVTCQLIDFRTGTSNLERWVTAFIGDQERVNRLVGRKVLIEETLDNGVTWSVFFYGRITNLQLDDPMKFLITITDGSANLQTKIFREVPTTSNPPQYSTTSRITVLPWGFENDLRSAKPSDEAEYFLPAISGTGPATAYVVEKDGQDVRIRIRASSFLRSGVANTIYSQFLFQYFGKEDLRAKSGFIIGTDGLNRIEISDSNGNLLGSAVVTYYEANKSSFSANLYFWVTVYKVPPVTGSNLVDSLDLNDLSIDQELKVKIMDVTDGHENFYLNASSPTNLLVDILDGVYSDGQTNTDLLYDSGSFNEVMTTMPEMPGVLTFIDKEWDAQEFIEQALLRPNGLGYYLASSESGSVFTLYSLQMPTSLDGVITISGSHLVTDELVSWETDKPYRIDVKTYYDAIKNILGVTPAYGGLPKLAGPQFQNLIQTYNATHIWPELNSSVYQDYVLQPLEIDAIGQREFVSPWRAENDMRFSSYEYAQWIGELYNTRFTSNIHRISLAVRRTDDVESLRIGDWVILDIDWLPDPNTRQRGGSRLVQVVGKNINGPKVLLDLMDGGTTDSLTAPNVTLSLTGSGDIKIEVEATEDAHHLVEYIWLPSGSTSVTDTDSRWTVHTTYPIISGSTETIVLSNLPGGKRIYSRARANRPLSGSIQLPSNWTTSTGVDLAGLEPPTNLTLGTGSYYHVTASWSASGDYRTEVWSTANESWSLQLSSIEEVGTTETIVTGFGDSPSGSNTIAIRHVDTKGARSPFLSQSFNRGAGNSTAPDLGGLFVFDFTTWG